MIRQPVYSKISRDHAMLHRSYMSSIGYIIPPNYVWDGMSMNKVALVEKFGRRVDIASLEHDWEYVHEGNLVGVPYISRAVSDYKLMMTLRECGVNTLHAWYIYALVRIFGWVKWKGRK